MPLCIRRAQYLDTYGIGQLLSLTFYPWAQWFAPLMDLLVALDVQSRFNEGNSHYLCVIALWQGQVVGTVEIAVRTMAIGRVPYLFNLAVHPRWQGQGIGTKLLQTCVEMIVPWHFPYLYLHVLASNKIAQKLYYRSGFECCQVEKRWLRPDRLLLRKSLYCAP